MLVADSGLGKTTLLKELQYHILNNDDLPEQIPVYFHYRDLLGVFSSDALLERVRDVFPEDTMRDEVKNTVEALFSNKRFLFLIDGLDQVEDRSNLPKLLGRHGILSSHRVILAGRPYAYYSLENELPLYQHLTLDTFSISLVKEYLGEERYGLYEGLLQEPSLRAPMILSIIKELQSPTGEVINRTPVV